MDVRLVFLFLVFEEFLISFFCCYNYTRNFRKGILEVKRYYEGRGINVCVLFRKVLGTVFIKDFVVNVYWSFVNVNVILDKAVENLFEIFVDFYDIK